MPSTKNHEQSQRLDRIEAKIDKLAETVVQMARVEEKLVSIEADKKLLIDKLLKIEERIEMAEKRMNESAVTIRVINRLFWIVITALVGTVAGLILIK